MLTCLHFVLLMSATSKNSFKKDTVDTSLYTIKAPVFSNLFQDAHKALLRSKGCLTGCWLFFYKCRLLSSSWAVVFQQWDPLASYSTITKTIKGVLNQKQLTHWYWIASPQRNDLARLRQAHPALYHRLAQLSPVQYKQPHQQLDIPARLERTRRPPASRRSTVGDR